MVLTLFTEDFGSATSDNLDAEPQMIVSSFYQWDILAPADSVTAASKKRRRKRSIRQAKSVMSEGEVLDNDGVFLKLQVDNDRKAKSMSAAKDAGANTQDFSVRVQ